MKKAVESLLAANEEKVFVTFLAFWGFWVILNYGFNLLMPAP